MCLEEIYPPIQNMSSKELSKMIVDDKTMIKYTRISRKGGWRRVKLIFLGDSITQGVGASDHAHSFVGIVEKEHRRLTLSGGSAGVDSLSCQKALLLIF